MRYLRNSYSLDEEKKGWNFLRGFWGQTLDFRILWLEERPLWRCLEGAFLFSLEPRHQATFINQPCLPIFKIVFSSLNYSVTWWIQHYLISILYLRCRGHGKLFIHVIFLKFLFTRQFLLMYHFHMFRYLKTI